MEQQIPLNHEASAGETNKQVRSSLPTEVVQCLENARFLHLATCSANQPHVSLMSYTYLPSSPYSSAPTIVMTTNPASKKMNNLVANSNVSLLVHDWISQRPPTRRLSGTPALPDPDAHRPSLASLLLNLNSSEVGSISATINGRATLLPAGGAQEAYFRQQHLDNHDGGGFVAGEEVRVVLVGIRDVRISDWKGQVRDWVLEPDEGEGARVNGDGSG